ncbi:ATP-binding cassette domain-containing protein [Denitrificimonas sp. JX-1]|uniref:ATP-binding cassette domain-containing protein n=1 Tax=Denitrificimonas halotolerans TaxID=3098930 RepID=A0ABU5GTW0_9GAMM|nr:ATP-binding cassette domain-containing protein [Denitrificimonas sp. JX-1]MDY7220304.1 ATP-binding cassette domain-containing protein [Denitrificimonas sp. JX-1]
MLTVTGLTVIRGRGRQQHCVRLPHLELAAGQILAVTGQSGCGKSTLLEALGLLLKPEQVEVFQLGQPSIDLAALQRAEKESQLAQIRAQHLGFVLQSGGLLPYLNVRDNIQLPRRILGLAAESERIEQAIVTLNLEHLLNKRPSALSIGERQRVACLRAIAHEPQLLLADEPTAALDPHSARRLFEVFLDMVNALQLSALVVSHDWALVKSFNLPILQAHSEPGESTFALV